MNKRSKNLTDFFNYKPTNISPARGRVLIAEPLLEGQHFSRSVILLTEHNKKGSMGLVLNKPLRIQVNERVDIFPTCKSPLFLGGPVDTDHLFFIHTLGKLIPESYPLGANLFWGGDLKTVQELLENGIVTESQIRFFSGYAGWSIGQLEDEIDETSWVVSLLSTETLMQTPPEKLWKTAIRELGGSYNYWLNFPENPIYN